MKKIVCLGVIRKKAARPIKSPMIFFLFCKQHNIRKQRLEIRKGQGQYEPNTRAIKGFLVSLVTFSGARVYQ